MENLLPASQTGAESSLLSHGSFWRRFLIVQFVVLVLFPLKGYPDTYPATREYYAWIGSGVSAGYTSPAQPDFLNAGNVAWDGWQVPVFWPSGITKVEWFTDGNCQGKAEPLFISQSSWVLVWASYQWPTGAIGCSGTSNYIFINLTCPYGGNVVVDQCYNAPPCLPPSVRDTKTGKCELSEIYTLILKPDRSTTEPSTNLGLTVSVENQDHQPPKNPVQVKISLKVDHKSGGHDHGDSTRPRGGINGKNCESDDTCATLSIGGSDSSGSTSITFNARDASGEHTITATCDKCRNGPQEAKVKVKVEGLSPIPALPFYTLTEVNGNVIGAKSGWHTDNHNLTPAAATVLAKIAVNYRFHPKFYLRDPVTNAISFPPVLHLNDASLPWGGVYDICARPNACTESGIVAWHQPHIEHRRGTTIDVRANTKNGTIPASNKAKFTDYLIKLGLPYLHEDPGTENEHFHIRLMKKKE